MEGRVLSLRKPIVRCGLAALITCCLLATMLPVEPAAAEEWIPAGSSAVITAGAPLAVRAAPGWDAAVAYEIADGSFVTVWDGAQAAPDGSLWYPVDGGFVPVDAVSSPPTLDGAVALYQDAGTEDKVAPATADPPAADAAAADQAMAPAPTEEWVEPAAPETATAAASKDALTDPSGAADAATSEWTEPVPVEVAAPTGAVDPATGEWVNPATVDEVPATAGDAAPVASEPAGAPAPLETGGAGGTEPWGEPIATAYIAGTGGDGAACLAAPDWGAAPLTVLGEGEAVAVRAQTIGEWQPVNCAGAGGYVNASLIAWTQMAASEESNDGGRREREGGRSGKASGGNAIVDFAMRYEGNPYVYAGEGPRAFDCSGFTMFVIQKTLGIDITHDMFVQYDMGSQVGRNALQPGDLVFFKNTFRRGLSHTGIYIGGGQFIHAENESTGVRISDLDSDYYSSRWYGAVRYS
jgi:cell wall-associated NlpC family hydrolase